MFLSHDFQRLGALLRSKDPVFHWFLETSKGNRELQCCMKNWQVSQQQDGPLYTGRPLSVVFVFPPRFDKLSEIYRGWSLWDNQKYPPWLWRKPSLLLSTRSTEHLGIIWNCSCSLAMEDMKEAVNVSFLDHRLTCFLCSPSFGSITTDLERVK